MKEIALPITQTFTMSLDMEALRKAKGGESGRLRIPLGTLVFDQKTSLEIETARKNGGLVLYATTSIEQKLESVLLDYFMGRFVKPNERRDMFQREILQSTALSYSAKKELVTKVITKEELLPGKRKNVFQGHLKTIMEWRNAFAHGKIEYDTKIGCLISYYSGHAKKLHLTDEYWIEVEKCYKECDAILDEVLLKLGEAAA
ncbi:hypothetical protein [Sideroxydans sp. CL21]|uniref:hypothetical protein n=1 Tax=Sideroxydans sp. CL21 TaxID=2600596 RepID=UPI0012A94CCF|nr:hypothetical protein [Sideroxydans sp. CL21]VVC82518.1 hypothetical protein [Sideroxydans sp. CL21]